MVAADPAARDAACGLIAETLRDGHAVTIRVQGTSMMPAIWPGDRLTVRPQSGKVPAAGEIVLTRWAGGLRAHRVVACTAGEVTTQGDALETPDPPLAISALLGVIVGRNGRRFNHHAISFGNVIGRIVATVPALRFITLKLITLRRRFEETGSREHVIA